MSTTAMPFPRHVLRFLAFNFLFSMLLIDAIGKERPNILVIVPDQMRATAMGCAGNPDVQTPHIDQLAAEGIHFTRTYANSPVCGLARATLMTGTYPHVNGMLANDLRLREDSVTIAKVLRDAGYRTGFVGKWHLDGGPRMPGFVSPGERRQGFEFWAAYQCHHLHFSPTYFRDQNEEILIPKFEPEATTDFAIEFLETHDGKQPFFLTVLMGPPHDPYGAPEEYMKLYDPDNITLPANWEPNSESGTPGSIPPRLRREGMPEKPYVALGGREEIAAYYAAITAIDVQVGRMMKTLETQGLSDNTIVLFTSDHGDMLGSHGLRRKRKPHDESARVPGIVKWPAGTPRGVKVDTLFSLVDMAPTLIALTGTSIPEVMQGADLSRVIRGETTEGPEAVLLQIFVPFNPDQIAEGWRGIITAEHTYARYENEPWVLFDHANDPDQMSNLVQSPSHLELAQTLDRQLAALMKKHGDAWSFNSTALVEERGRLFRHGQTFYTIEDYLAWAQKNPDKAN